MKPPGGARAFLDEILARKQAQELRGFRLEVVTLPLDFFGILQEGCLREGIGMPAYGLSENRRGETVVHIHGVKVMWSKERLPGNQAWFRYSGGKKK